MVFGVLRDNRVGPSESPGKRPAENFPFTHPLAVTFEHTGSAINECFFIPFAKSVCDFFKVEKNAEIALLASWLSSIFQDIGQLDKAMEYQIAVSNIK